MAQSQEDLGYPPPLAAALVRTCCERATRESVLGDLHEGFISQARINARAARRWYWREALAAAAPLLGRRVHRSALASSSLMLVLSLAAIACLYFWQVTVARNAAWAFAETFPQAPNVLARLVYVLMQMFAVACAAALIATFTFRAEQSWPQNAIRQLTVLTALVIAPPLVESLTSPDGYSLDFIAPWAGAMAAAIWLGGRAGERYLLSRQ